MDHHVGTVGQHLVGELVHRSLDDEEVPPGQVLDRGDRLGASAQAHTRPLTRPDLGPHGGERRREAACDRAHVGAGRDVVRRRLAARADRSDDAREAEDPLGAAVEIDAVIALRPA